MKANVSVYRGQTRIAQLAPAVAFYGQSDKRTSEVDIRRTLAGDLYLALTEADSGSKLINLTIYIKPLINWIWIGSGLMVLGTAARARGGSRTHATPHRGMDNDVSEVDLVARLCGPVLWPLLAKREGSTGKEGKTP